MRITLPPYILHHWTFKAAVIVSAFVILPLLWALISMKVPTWKGIHNCWRWMFEEMRIFWYVTIFFYTVGVWSIVRWWLNPCRSTFIWLFIAIPGLCGLGGVYLIYFLEFCLGLL